MESEIWCLSALRLKTKTAVRGTTACMRGVISQKIKVICGSLSRAEQPLRGAAGGSRPVPLPNEWAPLVSHKRGSTAMQISVSFWGRRPGSTFLVTLALLFLAYPCAAQFRPVAGHEYREFSNRVNPVRGEAVVGLSLAPTEADRKADVVQVFLPQPFSGEIRIETLTADGRFRGEGAYSRSSNGKEWVRLALLASPSVDSTEPSARPVNPFTLAIAARGPAGTLYLVRWGNSPVVGSSERVRLYVNSRRAEMFVRAGKQYCGARARLPRSPYVSIAIAISRWSMFQATETYCSFDATSSTRKRGS